MEGYRPRRKFDQRAVERRDKGRALLEGGPQSQAALEATSEK